MIYDEDFPVDFSWKKFPDVIKIIQDEYSLNCRNPFHLKKNQR